MEHQQTPGQETPPPDWTRTLFEAIDDAVFVHDLDGNILDANPAACRRLGYTREELLRLNTREIDAPEFGQGFETRVQNQLKSGNMRFEGVHRTKDGRRITVDINTSAIRLGDRPAVLAVMRDITKRKKTLEKMTRQRHLLRSVLANMGEAIIVVDTRAQILLANPLVHRLLGPDPLGPFLEPDQVTPFPESPLGRCLRGEKFDEAEFWVPPMESCPGGWLRIAGRPLRNTKGQIFGGILVVRDMTARRRNERRQEAHYAVSQTLAESSSFQEGASKVLQVLCEGFNIDVGVLWVIDPSEDCLHCFELWHAADLQLPEFVTITRCIGLQRREELPGQVWHSGTAISLALKDRQIGHYDRFSVASREGLGHAWGFPILARGVIIGVLEFVNRIPFETDEEMSSLMNALGNQIGQSFQRHQAEKAVRDSEAMYQSLVESLPQNILRKDRDGRFTFGNKKYCETVKTPLKDLLGKTDFDLFPPELAQKYVHDDQDIMRENRIKDIVEKHHLPNGQTIYVQIVKTPVYDALGEVVGIQGIFWDVTEKIRAEEVLANSERRYRQLTEATLDAIILADQEGIVQLFNPAAERMFGYKAAEVLGKHVSMLIPKEYQQGHNLGFERYLNTRVAKIIGRPQELVGQHKDGTFFPVEIALSVLSLEENPKLGPVQFLGALRDLTDRNKIRAALVQSEKLASIGLLSAGVAHEINNPLAFVGNNLAVLQRDTKGFLQLLELLDQSRARLEAKIPEFWNEYQQLSEELDLPYLRDNLARLLERSRDGVDRVTRIIHSLRGMARTESVKRQMTNLAELVDSSLEILRGRFKKCGIDVVQEHPEPPRVMAVPTQLSQVVLNVLVNAFQAVESYRKDGGKIRIRSEKQGEEMLLEITDNGPGIAGEHLPRIFDPFFTTKDVGEGTGLGLSITHNIVSAHGGRVEVDTGAGQGTCFRIYLPLKQERDGS